MDIGIQIIWLFVIAIPVASISWTITHEEIFREFREFFIKRHKSSKSIMARKIYYPFTCEFCFSHYVTIFFLIITRYTLLFDDWRGYIIAGFSIVWIANQYMSIFLRLRLDIKKERVEIEEVNNGNKQKD